MQLWHFTFSFHFFLSFFLTFFLSFFLHFTFSCPLNLRCNLCCMLCLSCSLSLPISALVAECVPFGTLGRWEMKIKEMCYTHLLPEMHYFWWLAAPKDSGNAEYLHVEDLEWHGPECRVKDWSLSSSYSEIAVGCWVKYSWEWDVEVSSTNGTNKQSVVLYRRVGG